VASFIACFPALSVPEAGGPLIPVMMVSCALKEPSEEVVTTCARGFVQLTGTWLPSTVTVGSPPAPLHSANPPGLFGAKPVPLIVTVSPPLRHVPGSTVNVRTPAVADDGRAAQGAVVAVVTGEVGDAVVASVVETAGFADGELPQSARAVAPTTSDNTVTMTRPNS